MAYETPLKEGCLADYVPYRIIASACQPGVPSGSAPLTDPGAVRTDLLAIDQSVKIRGLQNTELTEAN
jgi:hypothetical protein